MIKVDGIGKQYNIAGARAIDLRSDIRSNIKRLVSRKKGTFWALQDISFQVSEGESLGIIGRNGAGKSTLLKILSRITYPTTGRFTIDGRLSSLLEVGTGFHSDLTGRENIYLNGTILGMRRHEVKRKFDEIVAFSGVEQFIDNPVKYYSSGQKVRLAFAVAAHLEPEVLIIDEVLAVGDVEFQRKCLGKMKDVASHGRTVLFVSHNMSAVNNLCDRCILLDMGRIEQIGPTREITRSYLSRNNDELAGSKDLDSLPEKQEQAARFKSIRLVNDAGETMEHAKITEQFHLELTHQVFSTGSKPQPVVLLFNSKGEQILTTYPGVGANIGHSPGIHTTRVTFPPDLLNSDTYYLTLWLVTWLPYKAHQVAENVLAFQILDDVASSTYPPSDRPLGGVIRPRLDWRVLS